MDNLVDEIIQSTEEYIEHQQYMQYVEGYDGRYRENKMKAAEELLKMMKAKISNKI